MFIGACGLVVEYVLANLDRSNKDVTRVQFPASAFHIIGLKEARITKPEENLVFAETVKRKVYKCDFHISLMKRGGCCLCFTVNWNSIVKHHKFYKLGNSIR